MKIQPDTSKLSYEKIMQPGALETHYWKILKALVNIKDGTSWEIADATEALIKIGLKKMKADQVWKRIPELIEADIVFDTGLRRPSPDGNKAMVYALSSRKEEYAHIQKPERQEKTTATDFASKLIASSAAGKRMFQKEIFEDDEREFIPLKV